MKFEIYEDNAGGLYFCVIGEDDTCVRIIENWEYDQKGGNLREAVSEFMADPDVYKCWDGDITDRIYAYEDGEYIDQTSRIYRELSGDLCNELIAEGDTDSICWAYPDRMGAAGLLAFGLERP